MKLSYAVQEILSFERSLPMRIKGSPTMVCHTNGGGPSLHSYFEQRYRRTGERLASHLQVMNDGRVHQYLDTDRVAYAAFDSNPFAIQVETEDDGHPDRPWTEPQLVSLIRIAHDLGVPGRPSDVDGPGIGGHNWFPQWNHSSHACPGNVRNKQLREIVIPHRANQGGPAGGHPAFPAKQTKATITQWQRQMAHRGWRIDVDGIFGKQSAEVAAAFQHDKHLTVTRRLDHPTWDAAWSAPIT